MSSNYKIMCRILLFIGFGLATACSKSDNGPDSPPETNKPENGTKTALKVTTNTTFGNILTDGSGKALYFFAADVKGTSACTGGCEAIWPIFYAEDGTIPSGIAATDLATITRADGKKQSTYKGWPLYYYAADATAADLKGDGVGGNWFVAKPDYTIMLGETQLVGQDGKSYTADAKEGTGNTNFLTDASGRTLYAFAPDTYNKNTYTAPDLSNDAIWPIFGPAEIVVPSAINKDDLMKITAVGRTQFSYKGHPLYYFGPDTKRGETKGVSVPAAGVWPVLTLNSPALKP